MGHVSTMVLVPAVVEAVKPTPVLAGEADTLAKQRVSNALESCRLDFVCSVLLRSIANAVTRRVGCTWRTPPPGLLYSGRCYC
jgi:hypothetical protein